MDSGVDISLEGTPMVTHSNDGLEFELEEAPTLPTRAHSGAPIKARVIRAMAVQHAASKAAITALDALIARIRTAVDERCPPPPKVATA